MPDEAITATARKARLWEGQKLNYLSHAYRFLDDPYFVAGVAIPDWIRVIGRQYRARRVKVESAMESLVQPDPTLNSFFLGIIQHHHDDQLFHSNERFILLNAEFAVALRTIHGPNHSARSHFLGHIIIELLLDSYLAESNPHLIDSYYSALNQIDTNLVEQYTNKLVGSDVPRLAELIARFKQERFLVDYLRDDGLLFRLNQVMKRVGLAPLGNDTLPWIALTRSTVNLHAHQLLECHR